jgi:hypothetical protein
MRQAVSDAINDNDSGAAEPGTGTKLSPEEKGKGVVANEHPKESKFPLRGLIFTPRNRSSPLRIKVNPKESKFYPTVNVHPVGSKFILENDVFQKLVT